MSADHPVVPPEALRAVTEVLIDGPIPSDLIDEDGRVWGPDDIADLVATVVLPFGVAAGRTQAAAELAGTFKRIAGSERESVVCTPPEYVQERARRAGRSAAFARAAEIAEGSSGGSARPSNVDPSTLAMDLTDEDKAAFLAGVEDRTDDVADG